MGLDEVVEGVVGGSGWGLGLAVLVGAALLAGRGGRPLLKGAIKGYLLASEQGQGLAGELLGRARELTAEAAEQFQDLYAEARAEVDDLTGQSGDLESAETAPA